MRLLSLTILLGSCSSSLNRAHELDVEWCNLVENGAVVNCPISKTKIAVSDAKRDFVLIRVSDVEAIASSIGACHNEAK